MVALRRVTVLSALISCMTLLMLSGAMLLANMGASRFWFGLLLLVPVTIGLPSTVGVLLVTGLWNGSRLWTYLVLTAMTALVLQRLCMGAWYRWQQRGQT